MLVEQKYAKLYHQTTLVLFLVLKLGLLGSIVYKWVEKLFLSLLKCSIYIHVLIRRPKLVFIVLLLEEYMVGIMRVRLVLCWVVDMKMMLITEKSFCILVLVEGIYLEINVLLCRVMIKNWLVIIGITYKILPEIY